MNKLLPFAFASASLLCACTSAPPANHSDPQSPPVMSTDTAEITAQWATPPDGSFGEIAVASVGDQGAIAYAQSEGWTDANGFTQTRVKLQRFDNKGAVQGDAIELGVVPGDDIAKITLASDGVRYIACWNGDVDKIVCAMVPVEGGGATPALSTNGGSPSLAHGAGGWALAYSAQDQLAILHLGDDGSAKGNPVLFAATGAQNAGVFLQANGSGFLLMGEADGSMRVQAVDNDFSALGSPLDLEQGFWFSGALAVNEKTVGVHLAKPYGSSFYLLDEKTILTTHEFDDIDAGKTGIIAALAPDGASFGMLTANDLHGLHYGLVDGAGMQPPAEVTIDNGSYVAGSMAVFTISGERFLAAAEARYTRGGSLVVARVLRP